MKDALMYTGTRSIYKDIYKDIIYSISIAPQRLYGTNGKAFAVVQVLTGMQFNQIEDITAS